MIQVSRLSTPIDKNLINFDRVTNQATSSNLDNENCAIPRVINSDLPRNVTSYFFQRKLNCELSTKC